MGSLKRANFSNSKLAGVTLFGADLSDANFTGADLTNANIGQCNLTGTIFKDANLSGEGRGETRATDFFSFC